MKVIEITIPDNLTSEQEALEIAKHLVKKKLPTNKIFVDGKKPVLIGDGFEVKELNVQINIKREPAQNPIKTIECAVCATIFEKSLGAGLWVNYGGKIARRHYCSKNCRQEVLELAGYGRAAIKKADLKQPEYRPQLR